MASVSAMKPLKPRKDSSAIHKNNRQNTRKPNLNRPKKRNIVRWNQTLNNRLLLCIQSACNTKSIKLPWETIAELMGGSISDGAITQHLTKLRARLEKEGEKVPPPLKRGGATFVGSANSNNGPKGSTATKPGCANMRIDEWSDGDCDVDSDDSDDSDDGDAVVAACLRNTYNRSNDSNSNIEKEDDADVGGEIRKDNNSESSSEYVAAGASFLQFPNDGAASLVPSYNCNNHDHTYKNQVQPKVNAGSKAKYKVRVQNHTEATSLSGRSPQQKVVKLRIPKGSTDNCGSNGAVVGDGNGQHGNSKVDALGRRFPGQNTSPASRETMLSSPAGTVDMDVRNIQTMIQDSGAVGHPHQQHYHHHQSPYGWPGSNSRSPHVSPAEMFRGRGHHINSANHRHNSHMASTGFQQEDNSLSMRQDAIIGMGHSATPRYHDNIRMYPNSGMLPAHSLPPRNRLIPISTPTQGGYSAEEMWHNSHNNNPHVHSKNPYHVDITNSKRPHHSAHDHDPPTYTSPPTIPYRYRTDTEPRTIGGSEIADLSSASPALVEHTQIPEQQQQKQHEQARATDAAALADQAAIMDGLSNLPQINNFDVEFAQMGGSHVEDLFGAYGYGMDEAWL
ncbi:conserved hypothetical protein [Histoplasma capsulatum var. duboisii H88]|uniref:Myb-like domain-containing protein n=2 Tax=Ajellomyces capsulatus TaxID=5037 RepID=F0UQP7_AJEC8|nr:conserved hypothetical protein [Histoplasma capsulatum H143]EGC48224.1 conserved hypothetical protein [Histoplasma capsulatum var. duboisii H88]